MNRILLVTTSYPERGEGQAAAGAFVKNFGCALAATGISVNVVAPAKSNGWRLEDGVTVKRFAIPRLPLSLLTPKRVGDWSAIAATLIKGARAVSESCNRQRPDHILALWALPSGDWAMRAGKQYGIPYSTWALGSDIWALQHIPGLRQRLVVVLRHAAHRFADGFQLSEDVERLSGLPCQFLASSRDFGLAGPRPVNSRPPYRLAFLGRWHPNKGVDLLLDALGLIGDRDWSGIESVRIHGGGPLEAQVYAGVARLRAAGRPVHAGGYLDLDGARELFAWTDYVLIPSRIESIPVVFSDAMQARRPVIAAPVGDLPRILKGLGCGILADQADPKSFAEAIRRALAIHPAELDQYLTDAAASFEVKRVAQSFLQQIGIP